MTAALLILAWYLAASIATFAAYAIDKAAARRHGDRIAERTLHLWSLAGGWPGAAAAQALVRHKSRKQPFRAIFWLTIAANLCLLAAVFRFACIA
jgi:uncharacterized membrane protein YsdA (DUF1294 family)